MGNKPIPTSASLGSLQKISQKTKTNQFQEYFIKEWLYKKYQQALSNYQDLQSKIVKYNPYILNIIDINFQQVKVQPQKCLDCQQKNYKIICKIQCPSLLLSTIYQNKLYYHHNFLEVQLWYIIYCISNAIISLNNHHSLVFNLSSIYVSKHNIIKIIDPHLLPIHQLSLQNQCSVVRLGRVILMLGLMSENNDIKNSNKLLSMYSVQLTDTVNNMLNNYITAKGLINLSEKHIKNYNTQYLFKQLPIHKSYMKISKATKAPQKIDNHDKTIKKFTNIQNSIELLNVDHQNIQYLQTLINSQTYRPFVSNVGKMCSSASSSIRSFNYGGTIFIPFQRVKSQEWKQYDTIKQNDEKGISQSNIKIKIDDNPKQQTVSQQFPKKYLNQKFLRQSKITQKKEFKKIITPQQQKNPQNISQNKQLQSQQSMLIQENNSVIYHQNQQSFDDMPQLKIFNNYQQDNSQQLKLSSIQNNQIQLDSNQLENQQDYSEYSYQIQNFQRNRNQTILQQSRQQSRQQQSDNQHSRKSSNNQNLSIQYVLIQNEDQNYQGFIHIQTGFKKGIGKLIKNNDYIYEGQWDNNQLNGFAKQFTNTNQLVYQGFWKNNLYHRRGRLINQKPKPFQDQFQYNDFNKLQDRWVYFQGLFNQGNKSGEGILRLTNGEVFQGTWDQNSIQGQGQFYSLNGQIIKGIWYNNKFSKNLSGKQIN